MHATIQGCSSRYFPDLPMLWNDLKGVASRWRELGIQLDLDDGELNAISADDSGVAACMRRVLNEWMAAETDDGERKRQIVAALSSPCLGETRLARQLDRGGFVFNSCSGQYTIVLSEQGTVPTLMLSPRHSVHCMHAITYDCGKPTGSQVYKHSLSGGGGFYFH